VDGRRALERHHQDAVTFLELSVVVPTIGRPELLRALLQSIQAGSALPSEIVVVDQSEGDETARVVEEFAAVGARRVASDERGVAKARNLGLREAAHDLVACTDDDCTVASDWLDVAHRCLREDPTGLFTGRVLIGGDQSLKLWARDDPEPHDYTGELRCSVLYSANMAVDRRRVLDLGGGFDERLDAAEDNDLCYRWLRADRRLVYRPDLVVWHHAWRADAELRDLHVSYARWQGVFYGKHLRHGDLRVLKFLGKDLVDAIGGTVASTLRGKQPLSKWRRGVFRGTPRGLVEGWRRFR
jgi:GT2 family glycosyltransferase